MLVNDYKIKIRVHRDFLKVTTPIFSTSVCNYLEKMIKHQLGVITFRNHKDIKITSISSKHCFTTITFESDRKIMDVLKEASKKHFNEIESSNISVSNLFNAHETVAQKQKVLEAINKELDEILTEEDYLLYA